MAISKKDAKKAAAILRTKLSSKVLSNVLGTLGKLGKSKSFRRSIKRISQAVEQANLPVKKKAA